MNNPTVFGVATSVPRIRHQQSEILAKYLEHLQIDKRHRRAASAVFQRAGVESRYSVVDEIFYGSEQTTMQRNDRYMLETIPLGESAICKLFEGTGYNVQDIDDFIVVSCTGFNIPGLDLHLAKQVGMRADLKRACVLGMGCYGAFPALMRARDAAAMGRTVLVLTIELCSLHLQFDGSLESIVASALFADGASAVLIGPEEKIKGKVKVPHARLVDAETHCDYNTLDQMAFNVTDHGFKMHLSSYVPDLLAAQVEQFIDSLLARNNVTRQDIKHWGVHPGSSKILDHIEERLGLASNSLDASRAVLREYGNMSSATILFVLDQIQRQQQPRSGEYGLLMAFGPGLTMEATLIRW